MLRWVAAAAAAGARAKRGHGARQRWQGGVLGPQWQGGTWEPDGRAVSWDPAEEAWWRLERGQERDW